MAVVILRATWLDYADDKVDCVEFVDNDNNEPMVFSRTGLADEWLEENHDVGYSYHIVEI